MKCNCQFGYDDCSFPDCYTKQELVDVIGGKNSEIESLTAQLEAQQRWIPVSERLPERYGEYLASRRCRPSGWVCTYASMGWIVSEDYPVTHWMPLPTPPKEDA